MADSEADNHDVNVSADVDAVSSSSTVSRLVTATAGLVHPASDIDTQNNNNNNNTTTGVVNASSQASSSVSSVASLLSRRTKTPISPTDGSPNVVTIHDVRKFVFQATARSDKRVMGGLRAHTFTSQTFISSFAVGLAIGSILAIIIKLLTEVGYRMLPYHR